MVSLYFLGNVTNIMYCRDFLVSIFFVILLSFSMYPRCMVTIRLPFLMFGIGETTLSFVLFLDSILPISSVQDKETCFHKLYASL